MANPERNSAFGAPRAKQSRSAWPNVFLIPCVGLMLAGAAPDENVQCREDNPDMRVSDMQYVTTHNAFHIAPDDAVLSFVRRTRRGESVNRPIERIVSAHDYTHPTLAQQLAMGVRAFEIDVHDDPTGGRFSQPNIYSAMPRNVVDALPPIDPSNDLAKPGFKTFHEADFDMRSTCLLFRNCLKEIANWHRANPQHLPIFILLEMKQDAKTTSSSLGDNTVWRRIQEEILGEFVQSDLINPSDIAHDSALWPTLVWARGKVTFLLFDYGDRPVERYAEYISASGDHALLHIEKDVGGLRATWQSRNDPATMGRSPAIKPGLLLYTKGDTTGVQDSTRAKTALASQANFVATDFLTSNASRTDYSLSINGKYTRLICDQR